MPESNPTQDAAATADSHPSHFGDNKGIKFLIRTGSNSWSCTLQDRGSYERTKALRANSTDSVGSDSSATSAKST